MVACSKAAAHHFLAALHTGLFQRVLLLQGGQLKRFSSPHDRYVLAEKASVSSFVCA